MLCLSFKKEGNDGAIEGQAFRINEAKSSGPGHSEQHEAALDRQTAGVRRVFLWTAPTAFTAAPTLFVFRILVKFVFFFFGSFSQFSLNESVHKKVLDG